MTKIPPNPIIEKPTPFIYPQLKKISIQELINVIAKMAMMLLASLKSLSNDLIQDLKNQAKISSCESKIVKVLEKKHLYQLLSMLLSMMGTLQKGAKQENGKLREFIKELSDLINSLKNFLSHLKSKKSSSETKGNPQKAEKFLTKLLAELTLLEDRLKKLMSEIGHLGPKSQIL